MAGPVPLRRYISLHLSVQTLIPAILIAILVALLLVPQMLTNIGLRHQALARVIAGELWAHLIGGERQLVALADVVSPGAVMGDEAFSDPQLTALLDAACGEGELFETIYLVAEEDHTIRQIGLARSARESARRTDLLGVDLTGRKMMRTTLQEMRIIWSETFLSTVSGRLAVAVVVPLPGRLLVGEITLEKLSLFISQLPVEANLLTLVLDRQGRVVADSRQTRWGQHLALAELPADNAIEGERPISQTFTLDGEQQVGSTVAVDRLGWKVLVAQSAAQTYRPIRSVFVAIASGLAIALALALVLARRQAATLSKFTEINISHARSIAAGNYDLEWPPAKTREDRDLADSLRLMAEKIQRRERRLTDITTHVPGVVYQFEAIGDHDYRVIYVSEQSLKILGLAPSQEPFFETFAACIHPDERAEFIASIREAVDAVAPWNYEGRFIKPDGATIWFSGSALPREEADAIVFFGMIMDITERKAIDESLRITQFIFNSAPIGIWHMGLKGEILDVNEAACASVGYSREELGQMTVFDIDPDFKPEQWDANTAKLFAAGHNALESRHQRKNGEIFPVQIISNLVQFEEQEIGVAFVQDITERKQMEQSLKESEELFRKLSESSLTGIYHIEEGRFRYVNQAMADMFGYSFDELVQDTNILDLIAPTDRDLVRENLRRRVEGEVNSIRYVFRGLRKDGSTLYVEVYGTTIELAGKSSVIGTLVDITQQKKDEEEVRRLQNYLSNIVNSMPSVLVAVNKDGCVTQWNKTAELTTGIEAQNAYGKELVTLIPHLAADLEGLQKRIKAKKGLKLRSRPRKLADGIRYEDVTIYPLVADGEPGAVIRVDDVTEKVRLEEMMIQNEKMLSVGGLAAGMAHEINNPLAGIMQTADVMANRLGDNITLPASVRVAETIGVSIEAIEAFMKARGIPRMLDTIKDSCERVAGIVDNMLSFARKSEKTISSKNMVDIIDKTLKLAATDYNLKKRFDFRRIEIQKEYAEDVPAIQCEDATIQQVLLNVFSNGAQAMHAAGTASPRFILRLFHDEVRQMVCMEIEDNGPGMDEATQKRVFEPFFTTKPVGIGTGLGLSVSYFIVTDQHQGEMKVVSSPGSGAKFIINLPITR
jgi:PAS domain S-box-containing protein